MQDIRQIIDICAPYDKMNKIQDFLRTKPRGHKTIVFCGTKRMCDQVLFFSRFVSLPPIQTVTVSRAASHNCVAVAYFILRNQEWLQVCHTLNREFGAAAIHGDKRQQERDWVLRSFKDNHTNVLVATDVAARGLDIRDVQLVINFDFPQVCIARFE